MVKSLYEYYSAATTGEYEDTFDTNNNIFGGSAPTILAQTFTVGNVGVNENFTVEEIQLNLLKSGTPAGDLTVEIRTTNVGGEPDRVLATGTIAMTDIGAAAGWVVCNNFVGNTTLTASTKYAIVIHHIATATIANYIRWFGTLTVDGYAGGIVFGSQDVGANWVDADALSDQDLYFQVWGDSFAGTLCTYEDVINKVGAGASATAKQVSVIGNFVKQVESVINSRTRKDWIADYATLSTSVKYFLNEIASDLAAIKVINYDYSGYSLGRLEAQEIMRTLRDEAELYIRELKEQNIQTFMENA